MPHSLPLEFVDACLIDWKAVWQAWGQSTHGAFDGGRELRTSAGVTSRKLPPLPSCIVTRELSPEPFAPSASRFGLQFEFSVSAESSALLKQGLIAGGAREVARKSCLDSPLRCSIAAWQAPSVPRFTVGRIWSRRSCFGADTLLAPRGEAQEAFWSLGTERENCLKSVLPCHGGDAPVEGSILSLPPSSLHPVHPSPRSRRLCRVTDTGLSCSSSTALHVLVVAIQDGPFQHGDRS